MFESHDYTVINFFKCHWEFIPNAGCSNRERPFAHVQFSSGNNKAADLSCLGMLVQETEPGRAVDVLQECSM